MRETLRLWKLEEKLNKFSFEFLSTHTLLCPIKDRNYGTIKWGYVTTVQIPIQAPVNNDSSLESEKCIKLSCSAEATYAYLSAQNLLDILKKFKLHPYTKIISVAYCNFEYPLLNLSLIDVSASANGFCFEPPKIFSKEHSGI